MSSEKWQQLMMNPYLYYCRYILNLKQLTNAYENSTNDIYKREFGIVVHNTVEHMIFTDNQEDYAQNFMIHAKREVDILFFKRSVLSDIVAQREYVFWMWEQKLANIALWLHNNEMELRKKFIVSETLHEQKYRIISDGDALQLKQPQNRPILTLVPEREMLGDFRAEDHIVGVHDDSIMNKTMQPSVEVEFEKRSNELQPLKFEVVCDRIDFVQNESGEEYIIITDYKTGVLPSSKHILDWNYPQLLFEGLIVEQALARGKKAKIMLRYLGLYGSNSMAGIEKWISFDYEKNYAILRDIVVKYYHDQEPYYSSGNHYDNEYKYVLREI